MSAAGAGRLYACTAAAFAPDFGRRWPRRRLGWRFRRRLWWRPRLWRWRLLRRLLRRRRFFVRRRFGGQHHHHRRRQQWFERFEQFHQRLQRRIERCCHRYRHRQFDLDDLFLGPVQFVHHIVFGRGDVFDRSGVEQHRADFQHQQLGQCLVLDRRGIVFGRCFVIDRGGLVFRQRVFLERRGIVLG